MRVVTILVIGVSLLFAAEVPQCSVKELYEKQKEEWVSLSGTAQRSQRGHLMLLDSTGVAVLKVSPRNNAVEKSLFESIKNGEELSIIGTRHSIGTVPSIRTLLIRRDNTTIFRHRINKRPAISLPSSAVDTELNRLKHTYRQHLKRSAMPHFIIGGSAALFSMGFFISATSYTPDVDSFLDLTGLVYGSIGIGLGVTTVRHLIIASVIKSRAYKIPKLQLKQSPITFDLQIKPEREKIGLYFIGKF